MSLLSRIRPKTESWGRKVKIRFRSDVLEQLGELKIEDGEIVPVEEK